MTEDEEHKLQNIIAVLENEVELIDGKLGQLLQDKEVVKPTIT